MADPKSSITRRSFLRSSAQGMKLKDAKEFKVVRSSIKNVEGKKIVTGEPLFGLDYHVEGMLIAMIEHPPKAWLEMDVRSCR